MKITVGLRRNGRSSRILCVVCRSPLRISLWKPAARPFGSYLGGGVRQNSGGYLVRDDLPLLIDSVPTEAVPPLALTSHWGSCLQTS